MKQIATFVVLLALTVQAQSAFAAPSDAPTSPAWQVTQRNDSSREYPYTRFTLVGKFTNGVAGATGPSVVIDCLADLVSHPLTGRVLSASVSAGFPLKVIYVEPLEIHGTSYFPKVATNFRANGSAERQQEWSVGADKTSATIPGDALATLLTSQNVSISAEDSKGASFTMQFDIPDSASVRNSCDIK